MSDFCLRRLQEERKRWRQDHPPGFVLKPMKNADGTLNMLAWEAKIPGKENTPWEGAVFDLLLEIPEAYPVRPPRTLFKPPLFHPNVYTSGAVCLSILNEHDSWKPSISMKQILIGVQDLLTTPNLKSPANGDAYRLLNSNPKAYEEHIRRIAKSYTPKE